MALLEDWSTRSIGLIEITLQKEAIDVFCEIPCFSYLKEAKKVFQIYLTLQFEYKPSCSKIIGITNLHFNRHTREEGIVTKLYGEYYISDKENTCTFS